MTVPDYRTAERRFTRTLERAFHAAGWPSYAAALADRLQPQCPDVVRARFETAHFEWSDALRRAAKVPEKPVSNGTGKRHGTPPLKVRRSPDDYAPLTPAVLAECRVRLAEAMAPHPSKSRPGRKRGPTIVCGRGT